MLLFQFVRFSQFVRFVHCFAKKVVCVRTSTESVQTTPMEIVAFLTLVICKHVTFSICTIFTICTICTLLRKKSGSVFVHQQSLSKSLSNGDCGILDISDLQTYYFFNLYDFHNLYDLYIASQKKWSLCSYINRVCPNHSNGDCGILDISDLQICYFFNLYDLYIASQKKWSLCSYINRVCPNHSNGDCGILDISHLQTCYFFNLYDFHNLYDLYIASQKKWSLCSYINRVCPNHSNGDCGILDISDLQICYFFHSFYDLYIASQKKVVSVRTSTESVQTTPMEIVEFLTLVICKHVNFFILFTICTICTLLRKKMWSLCSHTNRVCTNYSPMEIVAFLTINIQYKTENRIYIIRYDPEIHLYNTDQIKRSL